VISGETLAVGATAAAGGWTESDIRGTEDDEKKRWSVHLVDGDVTVTGGGCQ
jgi:hypothetical protein